MNEKDYQEKVYQDNCVGCPSRELCCELGQYCQDYLNDLKLAKESENKR